MTRSTPFVWQIQVRREVLDDTLLRRRLLRQEFVITIDNEFRV